MPTNSHGDTLAQYEQQVLATYFVTELRYPYVSSTLLSALAAWMMHGHVSNPAIAAWFLGGIVARALRALHVHRMKPRLAQGRNFTSILHGFALSSLITGLIWAVFVWMHLDTNNPLSLLVVGLYVAGHVGGAVTPLSIYLPAFYLSILPTSLSFAWLLLTAGGPITPALTVLPILLMVSQSGYARDTNQLHRESIRLRFENQRLISDLEARNAEVEHASRNKSLFLAGVSHDLKQPIRAIGMYTGFLRHSAPRDGEPNVVTQTAEKIETAVSAIHGQITRLLELSRLESGAMPLNLEVLELDDLFTQARDLMASDAQARGVQLRFALGRQRQVRADRRMLESILANFVSNAIKHTESGRVYVGTRLRSGYPEGQCLCIEVRDSGTGIAADQLPLLFDAYRSFDDRTASESHGLGLAIAKAQATYLGCDIEVISAPGRGSTFTLCGLRSARDDAQATATASST